MSGGVDSTAAALLLLKENYSLVGITMEIMDRDNNSATESAASVCKELSIPHFSVNIYEKFRNEIILPFCSSYTLGLTPNPCAECNEKIKFGLLWDIAEDILGKDFFVATGHYARIIKENDRHYLASLRKGSQEYFSLWVICVRKKRQECWSDRTDFQFLNDPKVWKYVLPMKMDTDLWSAPAQYPDQLKTPQENFWGNIQE